MSELRNLTRMGGDIRKIARLLQDKGRRGDTILAHINPREAALLREHGGSGEINPETGLMEFEDGLGDFGGQDQAGLDQLIGQQEAQYQESPSESFGQIDMTGFRPGDGFAENAPTTLGLTEGYYGQGTTPPSTPTSLGLAEGKYGPGEADATPQKQEKGFLESLSGGDKARLGLAGAQGIATALMVNKAKSGAQKGAEQIRQVGAPYTQRGLAEQSAAQRGELSAVGQQQLDAMRARAAQAGVARGGVGVAQQQRAEEDLRQRLNAARESFGLQLSQIGDKYTVDAIKAGMQSDAEVNQLYNQMFGNLARIAAPVAIQSGGR